MVEVSVFPVRLESKCKFDGCLVLDILINMSCCELWSEHCRSYRTIISSETGNLNHVLLQIVISTYLNTNERHEWPATSCKFPLV
jgi:hypothetical protein